MKKATFAMNCFWHPDALFGCQVGVKCTRVGYSGGTHPNPTYTNLYDHTEAIDIDYDPGIISYENLLQLFWKNHDATVTQTRQYRSVIFYREEIEKALALSSKEAFQIKNSKHLLTAIEPFTHFYNAEDYHQKYYLQTHHEKLFKSLGIKQKDLVDSEVASKLNGFVVGENTLDAFNNVSKSLGLSADNVEYIQKLIARGKQPHC